MDLMESLIASKLLGSGGGGGGSTLISKTITRNGEYDASDDDADGYSDVTVNVSPSLLNKTIKSNGTYKADAFNVDGFGNITVDVSDISTDTVTITATENGTYTGGPGIRYTVPLPSTIEPKTDTQIEMPKGTFNNFNLLTISYTNNTSGDSGTFTMKPSDVVTAVYPQSIESRTMVVNNDSDNCIFITKLESVNNDIIIIYLAGFTINSIKFDKYAPLIESVEVDVEPNVIEKTITENGTYTPEAGVDGFSEVVVNVPATEPDTFYRYVSAVSGTIVLRQKYSKVLGNYEVENKVFFNGYHLTDYDTIPEEIYNYIPDIDISSANWTNNTSTTQNGWISIAKHSYNQIRCYTESWGSYLSNIDIWAVVDIAGGNAQTLPWSNPYEVTPAPITSENVIVENAKICDSTGAIRVAFDRPLTLREGYIVSIKDVNHTEASINFLQYFSNGSKAFFLDKGATESITFSYSNTAIIGYFGSLKRDMWISIYRVPSYFYCIPEQN